MGPECNRQANRHGGGGPGRDGERVSPCAYLTLGMARKGKASRDTARARAPRSGDGNSQRFAVRRTPGPAGTGTAAACVPEEVQPLKPGAETTCCVFDIVLTMLLWCAIIRI
jgi:hypothetical protein